MHFQENKNLSELIRIPNNASNRNALCRLNQYMNEKTFAKCKSVAFLPMSISFKLSISLVKTVLFINLDIICCVLTKETLQFVYNRSVLSRYHNLFQGTKSNMLRHFFCTINQIFYFELYNDRSDCLFEIGIRSNHRAKE